MRPGMSLFALHAEGSWPHRRWSSGQRPDLRALLLRFDPQVVLELSLREEVWGERQSFAEADAEVHRNRGAAIEDTGNGGARHANMLGKLSCCSRAEELFQQFPWAGRVVHHRHCPLYGNPVDAFRGGSLHERTG